MSRLVKIYFEVFWSSIRAFPNDSKLQSNRAAPSQCSTNGKLRFPIGRGTLLAQKAHGAAGQWLFPRRLPTGGWPRPKARPKTVFRASGTPPTVPESAISRPPRGPISAACREPALCCSQPSSIRSKKSVELAQKSARAPLEEHGANSCGMSIIVGFSRRKFRVPLPESTIPMFIRGNNFR